MIILNKNNSIVPMIKRYLVPFGGPGYYGFWGGIFHKSGSWDFTHIQCSLRGQPFYSSYRGDGNDHYALCIYYDSDFNTEKKLSVDPAHAASGCLLFWIP